MNRTSESSWGLEQGEQETILNHHRTIFNAIRDRNPDAAEVAMKEHLAFVVREFKRKFFPD